MNLKPQDVLFLLKLVALGRQPWSFNKIAIDLEMSPSEVHAASNRAIAARLASKQTGIISPNIRNLLEFLSFGILYVFVPERGELTRGMPTAHAAAPLHTVFIQPAEPPPVWPDPDGPVRGESFSPLYKSVPAAAKKDSVLYELLALVDSIRGGKAREREVAKSKLAEALASYDKITES